MKRTLFLLTLLLLVFPTSSYARTWLVRKDGSGDCTTIQACVDSAGNGDTILVGPGVYTEAISMQYKSDVVLRSEGGPTVTTITNGSGALVWPCLECVHVTGESVIEGFTFDHCGTGMGFGGAILGGASHLTIRGNVFSYCSANQFEGGPGSGGAILLASSSGSIVQNTIYRCSALEAGSGGGIAAEAGVVIDRNVIAECVGGGIWMSGTPIITCNDVWANSPSNYAGGLADQTGMNGNISANPLFCAPAAGNLFLNSSSPCLDAPGCGLLGALPMGCGATPVQETTWGRAKALFR